MEKLAICAMVQNGRISNGCPRNLVIAFRLLSLFACFVCHCVIWCNKLPSSWRAIWQFLTNCLAFFFSPVSIFDSANCHLNRQTSPKNSPSHRQDLVNTSEHQLFSIRTRRTERPDFIVTVNFIDNIFGDLLVAILLC